MALPEKRSTGRALTASAVKLTARETSYSKRLSQPWQHRAMGYYDTIGEINFTSKFLARQISRVVFYPAKLLPDQTTERIESGAPVDLMNQIQDPGGGRSQFLFDYGRLQFLTGEGVLFGYDDGTKWKFLWKDEVKRLEDGSYVRLTYEQQETDEVGVGYRFWTPHPRWSDQADAPMRAVQDICVAKGTMVSTPTGARRIEDVRAGDEVWSWLDGEMVKRTVTVASSTGDNQTLKITAGRRTITCTPDHRLLVARQTKPGKGCDAVVMTEWVRAANIEVGDALVAADRIPTQEDAWELPDGTPGSEQIAYLLGQVTGDGHITHNFVQISTFNAARDETLAEIVRDAWGLEPRKRGAGSIAWYSVKLTRMLSLLGLRCPAPQKLVPPLVWQMPDADKRAFLRGYEDADGHVTSQGWQSHATSSPELARDLRHLYIELGENVSNIHVEERPEGGMRVAGNQKVSVKVHPLHRFQVYYGSRRRGALAMLRTEAQRAVVGESFTLAVVKNIEDAGVVETFDLTVPDADCFIADGVVSHNCEELLILTLGVRATALTRMTNGIITLPTQLSPNPLTAGMDEDPEVNPLLSDWIEHVSAQIENPGSVEARIPFLLEGDYEYLDKLTWVKTHDPATDYMERDLRKEAIERLALSLDMSPEDLLGYTNANHWTGRQVQLDRWRMFGYNKAEQFATALADAYLRPALRDDGYSGWQDVVIGFDDSQVVISPDRTEDALKAHAQGIINGEAARTALGWGDKDKLDGQEKDDFFALKLRDPGLLEGGDAIAAPARGPLPEMNGRNPADGPPAPGSKSGVSRRESVSASVVAGAAQMALHRCRELAGARIQLKCKECGNGSEKSMVAAAVGPSVAVDPAALVKDGADGFRAMLTEWGVPGGQAQSLQKMLEVYAARTLFETSLPELPSGFVSAIEKAKEVSRAVEVGV